MEQLEEVVLRLVALARVPDPRDGELRVLHAVAFGTALGCGQAQGVNTGADRVHMVWTGWGAGRVDHQPTECGCEDMLTLRGRGMDMACHLGVQGL